jgi:hypothetical protein
MRVAPPESATGVESAHELLLIDQSSSTYGVQLSVLASEGAERIGAITLTLKVPPAASSAKP